MQEVKIPDSHPCPEWERDPHQTVSSYIQKEEWNMKGMYAFVSWRWVNPLAEWIGNRKVLEVMAGAGWLAKALRERGIDIIATDSHEWQRTLKWELVTKVVEMGANTAIALYGKEIDIMVISWPYMDNDAYRAIKMLYKVNPRAVVIFIGQYGGGITANERFFEHFEILNDPKFERMADQYEPWFFLSDRPYLGKYLP